MSEPEWKVLVPVEVLEGETVPESVVDLLSPLPVVVLGYHVLPEQTPPGQARLQFEDRAQAKLDDIAERFREAGGQPETRLVFTHDEEQTIDRVADETGCDAFLIPNPAPAVERVLVPVRADADTDRIASFVAALVGGRGVEVTVYHVADSDEARTAGESVVDHVVTALRDRGMTAGAISETVEVSGTPGQAIGTAAADHDAVVMGESEPSLRSFLFGDFPDQVAAQSVGPVVVVRHPHGGTDDSD